MESQEEGLACCGQKSADRFLMNFGGSGMELSLLVRERVLLAPQPGMGCWLLECPQYFLPFLLSLRQPSLLLSL